MAPEHAAQHRQRKAPPSERQPAHDRHRRRRQGQDHDHDVDRDEGECTQRPVRLHPVAQDRHPVGPGQQPHRERHADQQAGPEPDLPDLQRGIRGRGGCGHGRSGLGRGRQARKGRHHRGRASIQHIKASASAGTASAVPPVKARRASRFIAFTPTSTSAPASRAAAMTGRNPRPRRLLLAELVHDQKVNALLRPDASAAATAVSRPFGVQPAAARLAVPASG